MDIYSDFFDSDSRYVAEFKNKGYPHFDSEHSRYKVNQALSNFKTTKRISHTFYPLIRYQIPKYKRREDGRIFTDRKNPRHVVHTARADANIYSFYRNILMNEYDKLLGKLGLDDCVIAYRKIPINKLSKKNKCNVHFANDAMNEIQRQLNDNKQCTAIAMDIEKFFDRLDHKRIKSQWIRVLGATEGLPNDHFTIYKYNPLSIY